MTLILVWWKHSFHFSTHCSQMRKSEGSPWDQNIVAYLIFIPRVYLATFSNFMNPPYETLIITWRIEFRDNI